MMYNTLNERLYDLALMRTLGAYPFQLSLIMILEGIILSLIGTAVGIVLAHVSMNLFGKVYGNLNMLGKSIFLAKEMYIILLGAGIGVIAALIPSIKIYQTDISKVLSEHT